MLIELNIRIKLQNKLSIFEQNKMFDFIYSLVKYYLSILYKLIKNNSFFFESISNFGRIQNPSGE